MSVADTDFRRRLVAGDKLIGAFVKTAAIPVVEILGSVGLDYVIIDQEHAPLDRGAIDALIAIARLSGLAALVRVAGPATDMILSALDGGATGVLVPHVDSAAKAADVARVSHYGPGGRGYSNSVRAAGYGVARMAEHVAASAAAVTVIAQIEDREALDEIDEIAATPGIDALFIGMADLTISLGETNMSAPSVIRAAERIAAAARAARKAIAAMAAGPVEAAPLVRLGTSMFVLSTDQGFLRRGATQAVSDFAGVQPTRLEQSL